MEDSARDFFSALAGAWPSRSAPRRRTLQQFADRCERYGGTDVRRSGEVCLAGGLLVERSSRSFARGTVRGYIRAAGRRECGNGAGSAFQAWHTFYEQKERVPFNTLCLGPEYSAEQIKKVLENCKLHVHYFATEGEVIKEAIRALSMNRILAWMHGRMSSALGCWGTAAFSPLH